jgi:hypothetical protein
MALVTDWFIGSANERFVDYLHLFRQSELDFLLPLTHFRLLVELRE